MKFIFYTKRSRIFLIGLSILCSTAQGEHTPAKLVFAIDLIRHGDRTPGVDLPKSPYTWGYPAGSLTSLGEKQELELGRRLRRDYIEAQSPLLPREYTPETLYARSTQFARTEQSAHALLKGLYPDSTISVEIVPKNKDTLLIVRPSLNPISSISRWVLAWLAWNKIRNEHKTLLKNWEDWSGLPIKSLNDLLELSDHLYIRNIHKIPQPPGSDPENLAKILRLATECLFEMFRHPGLTEPSGSSFIQTVVGHFEKAAQGASPLKYALYMGHDSSILAVLHTLEVPLDTYPDFASRLSFRLWKKRNFFEIQITLNEREVFVPACHGGFCKIDQIKNLLQGIR